MLLSVAWGKVIHEKNLKQKISWQCSVGLQFILLIFRGFCEIPLRIWQLYLLMNIWLFARGKGGGGVRMKIYHHSPFTMEESGEQCTVVFALIVTEPASECVCVCVGGWRGVATLPFSLVPSH